MTKKKQVSKTLKNVLTNETMIAIRNLYYDMKPVIEEVSAWWDFDMYSRKFGPAVYSDDFEGQNKLDLATFLKTIATRRPVLNVPIYKSMRPRTIREGERVVSKENRHGPLLSLSSNKDLFSFSIKINDANVITTNSVGKPRNFTITDPSGEWYDGWTTIEWDPSASENEFLNDKNLWAGNRVVFKHFVHPNRWTSFYGAPYFITKALIDRLTEEAKHYNVLIKKMLKAGIDYPEKGEDAKTDWGKTETEPGKSVKFRALEVDIDIPDYEGEYQKVEFNQQELIRLTKLRREWVYTTIPNLRFATRTTELAFFKYGENKMPHWLKNIKWEEDYKQKGKRIVWERLVIVQPGVGEVAVAIRKRVKEKAEIMAMNYNGGIE